MSLCYNKKRKQKISELIHLANSGSIDIEEVAQKILNLSDNKSHEKIYISAPELMAQEHDKINWIVENYIPAGGLVMLSAPPKAGKSFLSLDLSLRLAEGNNVWLNKIPITPCKVVYLDAENAPVLIKQRLKSLGLNDKCGNLKIITRQTLGLGRIDLTNTGTMLKIKQSLAHLKLCENDLIVFDSFRRLFSGNENDSSEVAEIMAAITGISPAAKLILHHLRKKGRENNSPAERVRGSVDITAAIDGLITINTEGIGNDTITELSLSMPRWTSGVKPIEIQWHSTMVDLAFSVISSNERRDLEFRSMKKIIDYLKETFESRTLNEITSHTGIGSMEIKGALATMQREGRIRISKVDGIIYYSLIQPS